MFKTKTVSHCCVASGNSTHVKQNQVLLIFPGIPTREFVLFSDNMIILLPSLLIQHVFMFPG